MKTSWICELEYGSYYSIEHAQKKPQSKNIAYQGHRGKEQTSHDSE